MINAPETAKAVPVSAPTDRLILRPYQEEALQAIVAAARRGVRRQLLAAPTGSGKTLIASRVPEQGADARLLYVAHRDVLLKQTLDVFRGDRPDRAASLERAEAHADPAARTVVASIQSLARTNRLRQYQPEMWPLMVVDEAHRCHIPSTPILLATGDERPIHAVRLGDIVWSWTGLEWQTNRVTRIWRYHYSGPMIHLRTASGRTLTTTPSHDIYVQGEKRHALAIAVGERLSMFPMRSSHDQCRDLPTYPLAPSGVQTLPRLLRRASHRPHTGPPRLPPDRTRRVPGVREGHAQTGPASASPWSSRQPDAPGGPPTRHHDQTNPHAERQPSLPRRDESENARRPQSHGRSCGAPEDAPHNYRTHPCRRTAAVWGPALRQRTAPLAKRTHPHGRVPVPCSTDHHQDRTRTSVAGLSVALQDRSRRSSAPRCHRGRRHIPLATRPPRRRPEEVPAPVLPGVDRAQDLDSAGPHGLAADRVLARSIRDYTGYVYDLEVEHTHNYIANGCLVGNSTAPTYLKTLRYFHHLADPVHGIPARLDGLLLGMTGTTRRTDEIGLDNVYDEVVYTATLAQMIERGYLVPLRGLIRRTDTDLSGVVSATSDGERDYALGALAKAVNTPARNQLVVDATRHTALAENRPTLVFACDIAHTEALTERFRQAGVRAAAVHGKMTREHQDAVLAAFRAGELEAVVNCLLWVEGVDIPEIAAIAMARPTQSALLFQQVIGRGSRLSSGKRDCLVIDFVDAARRHAQALVTLPTLVGLPADFDLGSEAAHEVARRFDNAAAMVGSGLDEGTTARVRSAADIPKLFYEFDLVKIAGMPPALSRLSPFVWQRLSTGALALTIPKARPQDVQGADGELTLALQPAVLDPGGQFEIVPNVLGHYEVRFSPGLAAEQKLGEYRGLDEALRAADQEIRTRFPDRLKLLDKNEPWRARPMTATQVAALKRFRKLGVLRELGIRPRDLPPTMSRGQATLWISRITLQRARADAARANRPAEPATPQQLWKLRSLGAGPLDGLTKDDARRRIGRILQSRRSE